MAGSPQPDDARLLRGCLEGRREAWDELVERYSPYIYFLIHATLRKHARGGDDDTVDDVHNDVFLALLEDDMKRMRSFRGDNGCTLRSWIRIITINRTIDRLKSRRHALSLEAADAGGLSILDGLADEGPDAETLLADRESPRAAEVISVAVEALSPGDHQLFHLFYEEGLDADAAAGRLGISKGAIYTRKCRMLDRMSRTLRDHGRLVDHQGRERGRL